MVRLGCSFLVVTIVFMGPLEASNGGLDYSQCAIDANETYTRAPNKTFLYDQFGKPTSNASEAWGISYESCKHLCRAPENGHFYDWNFLSQGVTSWVLPWLALTAQLPFGAKDKKSNLMALFLALGSPALMSYSLALTVLNSKAINRMFRQISANSQLSGRTDTIKQLQAPRKLLIEMQHIPIEVFNGSRREFAQLVVCPEKRAWWESLHEEMKLTKRGWTISLYAQVAWVSIVQILTVVQFFTSGSSNNNVGIGLAINSLWLWMIPIVLGWIRVGTQTSADSVKKAIIKTQVPIMYQKRNSSNPCFGIRDRTVYNDDSSSSRNPRPSANARAHSRRSAAHKVQQYDIPDSFWGFSIPGCELEPGQVFKYTRVWSHMNAAKNVTEAYKNLIEQQLAERTVGGQPWDHEAAEWKDNFRGTPEQMSRYISATNNDEADLPVHARGSPDLYQMLVYASCIAMLLQWGSTGAAMVIAYQ